MIRHMGVILGLAISTWMLAFTFLFNSDAIVPETKRQAQWLLIVLVTILFLSGGVAGWAFGSLL